MGTDVVQTGKHTGDTGADTETTVGLYAKECGGLGGFKEFLAVEKVEGLDKRVSL